MSAARVKVLVQDYPDEPSDVLCASNDIEKLIDCAHEADLSKPMHKLREIGTTVTIMDGEAELHIEETDIL